MRIGLLCVVVLSLPLGAGAEEPYVSVHEQDQIAADLRLAQTLPVESKEATVPLVPRKLSGVTHPCKTVFGYLPYWERSAAPPNIRWDLLSHLACFSIGVNSSGAVTTRNGWPVAAGQSNSWTSVVNTAHANGVKVILTVTLFDPASISTLMGSTTNKNAFFANMKTAIQLGGADGLNVDFEGTGTWRNTFHTFLGELNTYLKSQIPGCEVTFAGPALTSGLNTLAVANACDGIFIMGYAYAGSWSSQSNANAPLSSITSSVETQWGAVTTNAPNKLILGLPYYGNEWTTNTSAARSSVISYVGSTRFRDDVLESLLPGRELLWDSTTQTPWYRWNDGTNWHQVWYDDAASLGLKWDLVTKHNLAGVGMWALNYDGARPELWDELDRRYGNGCPPSLPDFDGDGDVDQIDFGRFQNCLTAPNTPQTLPSCWKARIDSDNDVDANDYLIFEGCMSGPGVSANNACLP